MADLKWIEAFIGGERTSSNGLTRHYTEDELQQVVDTYNPSYFKAPLIVSYPAHNTAGYSDADLHKSQLAFGFPEKLKRVGNRLLAGFQKISPKIKEWIGNGEILSFSSSFYLPQSPHNPYPGKLALRHVAACGVNNPACKGLATPELAEPLANFANYAEEQEGAVEFGLNTDEETLQNAQLGVKLYQALKAIDSSVTSFMGEPYNPVAGVVKEIFQRLRDKAIEDSGVEEAEKIYPAYLLSDLVSAASPSLPSYATYDDVMRLQMQIDRLSEAAAASEKSYQYEENQEDVTVPDEQEWQAQFEEMQTEFSELKTELNALQAENRNQKSVIDGLTAENRRIADERERDRVTSFVETLIRDRKLLPKDRATEIRDILALPNDVTADYGEDGELTARQRYMNKLGGGRELWSDKRLPIGSSDAPDFNESSAISSFTVPDGYELDRSDSAIYNRAVAYCETHKMNPHDTNDLLKAVGAVTNGQ